MGTSKRQRQKELHRAKLEASRSAERRAMIIRRTIAVVVSIVAVVAFALVVDAVQDDDAELATTDDDALDDLPTDDTDPTDLTDPTDDPAPEEPQTSVPEFEYGTTPCAPVDAERQIDFEDGFEDCIDPSKTYTATFETNVGPVVVDLDTERTPGTVNNFVNLARHRYYDGTLIFRIDGSLDIAQGGSPHTNDNSDPGPGYTITDEGGEFDEFGTVGPFTYEPGQLVMARSQGPNSAGAQYFFTIGPDASALDSQGTYVVFGKVTQGFDVLGAMLNLEDPDNPGKPERLLAVETVTITES